MVRTLHELSKPVLYLLLNSLARELVALQTLATTSSSVGVTSGCVAHSQHAIGATLKVQLYHIALHRGGYHLIAVGVLFAVNVFSRCVRSNAPNKTCFSFPIVHSRQGAQSDVLHSQYGFPFGCIQVFSTWFCAFGCPFQTEILGTRWGNAEGGAIVCVLPSLAWRCQLHHLVEYHAIVRSLHFEALTLEVGARRFYLYIKYQGWLLQFVLNPAGIVSTKHAFVVDGDLARIGNLWSALKRILLLEVGIPHGKRFHVQVGHRECINCNVLIIVLVMCGLRHLEIVVTPANDRIAEDYLLHRFLWLNPRTASQCETIADVNTHFQVKFVGLLQGNVNHFPELIAHRIGLTLVFRAFLSTTNGHQITASQAHILHRLKVCLDTLF